MGNRHQKLPLYAVVLSKKYLRGDAALCCLLKKKKNFLRKHGPKTKNRKIIKKGADRKPLHFQNQFIKQLGEAWRSHRANPTPKRKQPTLGTNPFSLLARKSKTRNTKS